MQTPCRCLVGLHEPLHNEAVLAVLALLLELERRRTFRMFDGAAVDAVAHMLRRGRVVLLRVTVRDSESHRCRAILKHDQHPANQIFRESDGVNVARASWITQHSIYSAAL